MKTNRKKNGAEKTPAFVARAERAFARVARKLRAENHAFGLPAVVWSDRKAAKQKAQRAAANREDSADVAWLKKARKTPQHYRPLSDVLADLKQ